ncbi:MAG: PHP domain-containing protein [Thermotogae bacterium]|nr:PHP domain-containing protein [Thermotogota bacterium]
MKVLDMHTHSNHSDGTNSVSQLMKKAKNRSLELYSITDHDGISSQQEAVELSRVHNINYIPGVEINAEFPTLMDILGYGIDINSEELKEKLKFLSEKRIERNIKMIELLREENFNITYEEVLEFAGSETVGRPHIAGLMIQKGYGTTISEIIETYLTRGKKCFLERVKFSPKETIRIIKEAGGTAVLAHPFKLRINNEQLENLIVELKYYGLDGIEAFHYSHSPEFTNYIINLAQKYNMLITAGSDFHGNNKPFVTFGVVLENQMACNIFSEFKDLII